MTPRQECRQRGVVAGLIQTLEQPGKQAAEASAAPAGLWRSSLARSYVLCASALGGSAQVTRLLADERRLRRATPCSVG